MDNKILNLQKEVMKAKLEADHERQSKEKALKELDELRAQLEDKKRVCQVVKQKLFSRERELNRLKENSEENKEVSTTDRKSEAGANNLECEVTKEITKRMQSMDINSNPPKRRRIEQETQQLNKIPPRRLGPRNGGRARDFKKKAKSSPTASSSDAPVCLQKALIDVCWNETDFWCR